MPKPSKKKPLKSLKKRAQGAKNTLSKATKKAAAAPLKKKLIKKMIRPIPVEKPSREYKAEVRQSQLETAGVEKIAISKDPLHMVYRVRNVVAWLSVLVLVMGLFSIVSTTGGRKSKKILTPQQMALVSVLDAAPVDSDAVSLVAVGDILPARSVETKMRALKDYTYPFQKVADFLRSADITFGNLESPLFAGINTPIDSSTFRGDPQAVQGFTFAGFDVMSVANNHTMNYKEVGLFKAINELTKAGIAAVGGGHNQDEAHTPAIITVRGKKVAFYAYNDPNIPPIGDRPEATSTTAGVAKMDLATVKNDVQNSLKVADFVVVSMHAGKEYKKEPTQFQKDFAHAAIDAGASVVLGHHVHVVQPVENYGNGVIFYGLGNFVFDQFFSEDVRTGLIAKIALKKGTTPKVELFPTHLDTIQPRILEGQERLDALSKLGL